MKGSALNQEKLNSILQCISEGIIYQEANGTISFFNLVAQRLFNIPESEARCRTSTHPEWHLVYEDGTPCPGERHPSMITLSSGRSLTAEIRGIARPGQPVTWLSINTRPMVKPGQELPEAVVIFFSDITARKQAEDALRESELRFRHLFQSVPNVAIQGYGPDGTTRYWNEASEHLYGYTAQEAIGRNLIDLIIPTEMRTEVEKAIQQMAETGQQIPASELSLLRKDGSRVSVFSSHATVQIPDQMPELYCVDIDISERKRAEQKLYFKENIIESAASAIACCDLEGKMTYANQNFRTVWGFNHEAEFSGRHFSEFWVVEGRLDEIMSELTNTGRWSDEIKARRKDGVVFDVHVTAAAVVDSEGNRVGFMSTSTDITAGKQQEKILREIIDNNPMSIQILDAEGYTLQTNSAYITLFGSVPPSGYSIFTDSQLLQMGMGKFFDQLRIGENVRFPDTYFNAHDSVSEFPDVPAWIRTFGFPLIDSNEKPGRYVLMHENITERKLAEEALQRSEEKFRQIITTVREGILSLDADWRITFANDHLAEMFGYELEELLGQSFELFIHEEDLEDFARRKNERQQGQYSQFERRFRTKDGGDLWAIVSASAVRDDKGCFAGSFGTITDITERKQSEQMLRENEEHLSSIFRSAPIGIGSVVNRELKSVNSRLCEITGYNEGELVGQSSRILYPSNEDFEFVGREKYNQIRNHGTGTVETRWQRKDGAIIEVLLSSTPVDMRDHSKGVTFTALDITDRKHMEADLRSERQYLTDIIDFLPDATFIIDTDQRVVVWNRAAEAMTGVPREEVLGKGDYAYAVPFYGKRRPILIDLLNISEKERGSAYSYVTRVADKVCAETFIQTLKDGEGAYLWGVAAPLYDRNGLRTGAVEVIKDITELKKSEKANIQLQSQLMQAQKMEAIGQLAGGVAHDFNNMLGVIIGYSELILKQVDPSQPFRAELEEIQKAARRSADLTRQLLTFARKQTVAPKVLDLNQTVEGMLNMLRRLIGENIHLIWMPGNGLWPIKMDPSQIDQILANLCVNARDAIAGVGKITVETENTPFNEEYCGTHAGLIPGEYVRIAVSDTGNGMDEETLAHIFEPFFTTKGVGEGTGLGLATVYGAVKQNNGFINAYSELGRGTTFTIYIPRYADKVLPATRTVAGGSIQSGAGTILLVEDEPMILKMTTQMLVGQGYHVLGAASPWEALRLAKENAGSIDLLMTDVIMPEMNGRDLAKHLFTIAPSIKCLFMSGYTASVIEPHGVLGDGVHFIQKPFTMKDLAAAVREAFDE